MNVYYTYIESLKIKMNAVFKYYVNPVTLKQ
jgi:hypothetical protein